MSKKQKVLLVGRVNVGKSTLFNRLTSQATSLVLDYAGVTRDFLTESVTWKDATFDLVDTGGLLLEAQQGTLAAAVNKQVKQLLSEAKAIVFVCDGTVGLLPDDRAIAKEILKYNVPTILAVNKIDRTIAKENQYEFVKLGIKETIPISAQHGTGIGDLLDAIAAKITPSDEVEEEHKYTVALLGRPNVGKSSLLNQLLRQERALVSDVPGTTREAIREKVRFHKETVQLVDTAGVRRKRSVTEELEQLMVKSSFQAVRDANIVLLLIDANAAGFVDQELKLAFYVFEQGKALIVLANKHDLMTEEMRSQLAASAEPYRHLFKKIETLTISCETGKNISKIMPLVTQVWERYSYQFDSLELTELFKNALNERPLYRNEQPLIVHKAVQVKTAPPTIVLRVNFPDWFGPSQLAFFENLLRSKYNLKSVPVKLIARKR